jgi:transposase
MGRRSEVPARERCEAVLRFLRRDEPAAVIARRYGVAEATTYRWRNDFLAAGEAALAGGTRIGSGTRLRQVAQLDRELESRDQVMGELTVANRVIIKPLGAVPLTTETRRPLRRLR